MSDIAFTLNNFCIRQTFERDTGDVQEGEKSEERFV